MHSRAVRLAPDHLVRERSKQGPDRQRQCVSAQKAHHGARTLQFPELSEDQLQSRLHFFIRIEGYDAGTVIDEPRWQRQPQFATRRFLLLALMKAHPYLMK